MTTSEQIFMMTNLENSVDVVSQEYNHDVVVGVLKRYNASNLETLNPRFYQDVFNDLQYFISEA